MTTRNQLIAQILEIKSKDLKWNKITRDFEEVDVFPNVFEKDNALCVSAEDGAHFADYYGECRGGYPWIHPELEALAEKNHMFWEWDDAGSISLWD